jgi:oxygen-independent coproporphyrinogen-3 oxidase
MIPTERPQGTAVYVQVPFCPERCDYCAIPVSVSQARVGDYLEALAREVSRIRTLFSSRPPLSLYLGGGSPTSLSVDDFKRLLAILSTIFPQGGEITVESRPEALTEEIVDCLRSLPSLRLSLGVESVDQESLSALGRRSSPVSPLSLLEDLRRRLAGSLSMDFICTGADFDPEGFLELAEELLARGLDHLSVYPLVIEERTVLALRKEQGRTGETVEGEAAENWREVCLGLVRKGWFRYEVANFARDSGSVCRHNLHVWQGGDYLGLGPGAHQKVGSVRYENVRSVSDYVRMSGGENRHPAATREILDPEEADLEYLYTNLRLASGLPVDWLLSRTDTKKARLAIGEIVRNGLGWIYRTESEALVLTGEGLFVLDGIASRLLGLFQDSGG